MTNVSRRGKVLLLLLAVSLALPWGLAAEPRHTAPPRTTAQTPSLGVFLTSWFGSWLRSVWGEEGLNIDPDGLYDVPPAPGPGGRTDEGANIDPDGLMRKEGLGLDPDGHTDHAGLNIAPGGHTADEGLNIDPNG
jgi:hypothetical protein